MGGLDFSVSGHTPTSTTVDTNDGAVAPSSDNFVYDFDLSGVTTLSLSGTFQSGGSSQSGLSHSYSSVSTSDNFTLHGNGNWTYVIDRADVVANNITSITFTLSGSWSDFTSGTSGTDTDTVTFNFTPCFAAGTGIATPGGERAVEDLAIGDRVTTADGRAVPVKWVGRVTVSPMFNPADRLEPVVIGAGAFGPGAPHSDLIVTADHGMVLDDLVINAGALVNGSTIDWLPWKALGETLTYYHVETEAHDVILANGAASETYLDIPDRQSFDNAAEFTALYGDVPPMVESARARITSARLLPAHLRCRLGISEAQVSCAF